MKVYCEHCHKFFDYEAHDGFCPDCGAYTSAEVDTGKTIITDTSGGEKLRRVRVRKTRLRKYRPNWAGAGTERKSGFRFRYLVILMVIAVMLVLGIWSFRQNTGSDSTQTELADGYLEPEEVEVGKTMKIGNLDARVTEFQWLGTTDALTKLDQKVLLVFYEGEWNEEASASSDDPRFDDNAPYSVSDTYLRIDGEYARCLYGVDLQDLGVPELQSEGIQYGFDAQEGVFAFQLPRDAEELVLEVVVYSEDRYQDSARVLRTYAIPIPPDAIS